jgi:hypothetical protein
MMEWQPFIIIIPIYFLIYELSSKLVECVTFWSLK